MDDLYKRSIDLHLDNGGKIEIKSKVPLSNRDHLSVAYTPGVAKVSIEIGKNKELARVLTLKKNTVAIISDGSAILGLGNLGAHAAIPVMEGKAAIFKEFADIDAFPICVETQDPDEIIKIIKNIAPVFGGINLEDISAPKCFFIEETLQKELDIPVMHDDQHGAATAVLAALINSLKLRGTTKEEAKIIINGVGAAGIRTAKLLLKYGFKHIVMADTKGAIYESRGDMNDVKIELAKETNREMEKGELAEIIKGKDVFIGLSKGDLLDEDMIRSMNDKPIVFALANPVPEVMPDVAKNAGAFIVATGRSDFPNQINNSLVFPGIFRGALDNHIHQFTDEMFIRAAENIAEYVKDPNVENILPSQFDSGLVAEVKKAVC